MRLPRQRNDREDTLYKIFNRLIGRKGDNVLDPSAMRRLRLIVSQLCRLYVIKVTLLQVTGDGYGMLTAVPAASPSRKTVEACFRARHGRAALMPDFDDPAIFAPLDEAVARRQRVRQGHATTLHRLAEPSQKPRPTAWTKLVRPLQKRHYRLGPAHFCVLERQCMERRATLRPRPPVAVSACELRMAALLGSA